MPLLFQRNDTILKGLLEWGVASIFTPTEARY